MLSGCILAGKQGGSSATAVYGAVTSYPLCTDSHQLWREMRSAFWVLRAWTPVWGSWFWLLFSGHVLTGPACYGGGGEEVDHIQSFPSTVFLVTPRHLLFAPRWEKIEGEKRGCCLGLDRICSFKTARQTENVLGKMWRAAAYALYTCIWDANYSCKACDFPFLSQHCA